jgi:hypothetical protein
MDRPLKRTAPRHHVPRMMAIVGTLSLLMLPFAVHSTRSKRLRQRKLDASGSHQSNMHIQQAQRDEKHEKGGVAVVADDRGRSGTPGLDDVNKVSWPSYQCERGKGSYMQTPVAPPKSQDSLAHFDRSTGTAIQEGKLASTCVMDRADHWS